MRKLVASLSVLAIASMASAQTIPTVPYVKKGYDDGSNETAWKLANPNGPSDWFNVDFDGDLASCTTIGICIDFVETAGVAGAASGGVYPEGAFPNAPDLGNPICSGSLPIAAGDGFGSNTGYACKAGSPADAHIAAQLAPGDSHTWMGSDSDGPIAGRSFLSTTGYAAGASPFTVNWMMSALALPADATCNLFINDSKAANVTQNDTFYMSFYGQVSGQLTALFVVAPIVQFLPPIFPTGIGGPCPESWQIAVATDCTWVTSVTITFLAFYVDANTGFIEASDTADLHIDAGNCGGCYGQKDDGILDSTIWKVQNPAGAGDWFNVNHKTSDPSSGVATLTSAEISSWDFCGFGPSWAEVGIYPANTALDGTGQTPDVANPVALANSTAMAAGAGDWGYPATMYDTPDAPAVPGRIYHVASKWPQGDSCIWLGSDTDGTDSLCGTPIPSDGSTSLFTTNDYTAAATPFTGANWMMKINWTP